MANSLLLWDVTNTISDHNSSNCKIFNHHLNKYVKIFILWVKILKLRVQYVTYLRLDLYLKPGIFYFCPFSGINLACKNVWGMHSILLQKLNKPQH